MNWNGYTSCAFGDNVADEHLDELVFAHPATNKPIDRSKLLKRFKAALVQAEAGQLEEDIGKDGEPRLKALTRFHDLRHTFGTRMAGVGVPMRTLQEWMGHADIKTTMIYADYAPSAHEAEWIGAAFGQSTNGATKQREPDRTEAT